MRTLQAHPGFSITFSNCMHGGKRNKLTKWWSSKDVFSDLSVLCDQKHSHAQWNPIQQGSSLIFPTAEEAAYPNLLGKRVIALILDYVKSRGAVQPETLMEQLPSTHVTSHRWVLDMLPKGKKLRPLVSEFQSYKFFLTNPSQEPEETQFFKQQLKGARVVQRQLQWGKTRVDEQSDSFLWQEETAGKDFQLENAEATLQGVAMDERVQAELCTIGIPREPWDFVARAVEAGHPRSLGVHLSENVMDMLRQNFSEEPYKLVKGRAKFCISGQSAAKSLRNKSNSCMRALKAI